MIMQRLGRSRMSRPGLCDEAKPGQILITPVSCWRSIKPSPSNSWVSSTSRASAVRWRRTMCWLPQFPNRTDIRFWHTKRTSQRSTSRPSLIGLNAMDTVPLTVEQLQRDLSRSAFINFLGLEVIEADPSKQEVSMRMVMRPEFERYPDSGQWHGGPIAAAIDTVGDYALAMMLGRPLPTVNFRVDYLKPAIKTSLTIVGRVRRSGKSVGV